MGSMSELNDILDEEQERTPIGPTPIVLNPKVDDEETILCCPECDEEIRCWASNHENPIIEYRCGCENLRRFKVRGVSD